MINKKKTNNYYHEPNSNIVNIHLNTNNVIIQSVINYSKQKQTLNHSNE